MAQSQPLPPTPKLLQIHLISTRARPPYKPMWLARPVIRVTDSGRTGRTGLLKSYPSHFSSESEIAIGPSPLSLTVPGQPAPCHLEPSTAPVDPQVYPQPFSHVESSDSSIWTQQGPASRGLASISEEIRSRFATHQRDKNGRNPIPKPRRSNPREDPKQDISRKEQRGRLQEDTRSSNDETLVDGCNSLDA